MKTKFEMTYCQQTSEVGIHDPLYTSWGRKESLINVIYELTHLQYWMFIEFFEDRNHFY